MNPIGFTAAILILYWGGFDAMWRLLAGIFIGRVIFEIALRRAKDIRRPDIDWRAASWIWLWLIGVTIIDLLGRYGKGAHNVLPEWIDLLTVVHFSLVMFYFAVSLAMTSEQIRDAVKSEERQIEHERDLNLPC